MKQIIAAIVLFFVIDALYLGITSGNWNKLLTRIQGSPISIKAVPFIGVYSLMIYGWYYFIYKQYYIHKSINLATKNALILGLVIYGVFDLTNMAIIKEWDIKYVIMDILWGGFLFSAVTYLVLNYV